MRLACGIRGVRALLALIAALSRGGPAALPERAVLLQVWRGRQDILAPQRLGSINCAVSKMRQQGLRAHLALRGGRAPPGVEEVSESDAGETWVSDRILSFPREKDDSWDPLFEAKFLIGDLLDAAEPLWNLSLCPAANSSATDSTALASAPENGTVPFEPNMRSDWRGPRIPMAPPFKMVSRADSIRNYNRWWNPLPTTASIRACSPCTNVDRSFGFFASRSSTPNVCHSEPSQDRGSDLISHNVLIKWF